MWWAQLSIAVLLAVVVVDPKRYSVSAIADRHDNVAVGKSVTQTDDETVVYDQDKMVDGKDSTIAYIYFTRNVTLTIDLGRSNTVRHLVIKLAPEAYSEMLNVSASLSYSSLPNLPTLHHTFVPDGCVRPKTHESGAIVVHLYRCCGGCCQWRLRGIGRYLRVHFTKKRDSQAAFGVQEVEVRGLRSPEGLNLALYQPVLEEHNASCEAGAFVANDAWSDELHLQVKRPPYRWRVDLGKAHKLTHVRMVYAGKWGSAHVVLYDDVGLAHLDNRCPEVRAELHQQNAICCDVSHVGVAARWIEVRGQGGLPQLVEVFVYPYGFDLLPDECPKATTTQSTPTPAPTSPATTSAPSGSLNRPSLPGRATGGYQVAPASGAGQPGATGAAVALAAVLLLWR